MKPEVAIFTKEHKATKADIWRAFRTRRGFRQVQVDQAHSVIGKNVPRYWESKGYLVTKTNFKGELVYELTPEGRANLTNGMKRFLENHPAERPNIQFLPKEMQ